MSMQVIGAGLGRTGTYSLKLALERLGFGPCYHMEEVLARMDERVPLWTAAAQGRPDWATIFRGYGSAVDWPVAAFTRELAEAYPAARFVLTVRSPESWVASFGETIGKLMDGTPLPPPMQDWLAMGRAVLAKSGVHAGLDREGLRAAFAAHTEAVKAAVPAERLLVFEVREGWAPLCAFLGVPVPDEPFPRTNEREEFWQRIADSAPAAATEGAGAA
ncbi:hypothetical protein Rumeso_03907 [Rubellimicrobium mesophilum DSM 19309]|uniref:Sulfotransferase family protein n=1 Tax=Rubellimicrobium mesophilum DSM 19309 TaxID=442562 RepID=A0A017HJT8_9RHOB|nr:sulfotransferase family protein [Rubellimicrobium mesophilum]EYD74611.1 hypothetical protein Rumeso_03907 [Rubellimicrobium mesophilum DSM 19309]